MIIKEKSKMKRLICILLCITVLFSMAACNVGLNKSGDVKNVKIVEWEASKLYSDDEINAPIQKSSGQNDHCFFMLFFSVPRKACQAVPLSALRLGRWGRDLRLRSLR